MAPKNRRFRAMTPEQLDSARAQHLKFAKEKVKEVKAATAALQVPGNMHSKCYTALEHLLKLGGYTAMLYVVDGIKDASFTTPSKDVLRLQEEEGGAANVIMNYCGLVKPLPPTEILTVEKKKALRRAEAKRAKAIQKMRRA